MLRPEKLTGYDLEAIKKVLGVPWTKALSDEDPMAIYAFVWIAERREDSSLTWEKVKMRPFAEVQEAFVAANEDVDPTSGRNGPT